MLRRSWWAALACTTALAQNSRIDGPVLGFIQDTGSAHVRVVRGIAAAGAVSAPLEIEGVAAAESAAGYAMVLTGEGRTAGFVGSDGALRPLPGVTAGADRIVCSRAGSAAAFVFNAARRIEVVTGLPRVPHTEVFALAPGRGTLSSVAVNDAGDTVAWTDSAVAGAWSQSRDADLSFLPTSTPVSSLAFSGTRLFAAAGSSLLIIDGSAVSRTLPLPEPSPDLLAVTRDGRTVLAASRGQRTIASIPLSGEAPSSLACHCEIGALAPMNAPGVFRLTTFDGRAIRALDLSGPLPRFVFLPRAEEPEADR